MFSTLLRRQVLVVELGALRSPCLIHFYLAPPISDQNILFGFPLPPASKSSRNLANLTERKNIPKERVPKNNLLGLSVKDLFGELFEAEFTYVPAADI